MNEYILQVKLPDGTWTEIPALMGASVTAANVDENGNLILTLSSGVTINAGKLPAPVKGKDYFTDEEKQELVNEIKSQIETNKAGVLTIDGVDYTLRTGTEGAEGFITFVLEE